MNKLKQKQIRRVELRNLTADSENNSMHLSGHAAVYDSPTVLWECDGVEYKEVIARGAFDNILVDFLIARVPKTTQKIYDQLKIKVDGITKD